MQKKIFFFLSFSFFCLSVAAQSQATGQSVSSLKDVIPAPQAAVTETQKDSVATATADKNAPLQQSPVSPAIAPSNNSKKASDKKQPE